MQSHSVPSCSQLLSEADMAPTQGVLSNSRLVSILRHGLYFFFSSGRPGCCTDNLSAPRVRSERQLWDSFPASAPPVPIWVPLLGTISATLEVSGSGLSYGLSAASRL